MAIIRLCCLGDVALSTPLARALRAGLPQAEITYVTAPFSAPAAQRVPFVDRVLVLPEGGAALLRGMWGLRREGFDLAVLLHKSSGAALGCTLTGPRPALASTGRARASASPTRCPSTPRLPRDPPFPIAAGPAGPWPDQGCEETELRLLPGDREAGEPLLRNAGFTWIRPPIRRAVPGRRAEPRHGAGGQALACRRLPRCGSAPAGPGLAGGRDARPG